MTNRLFVYGSLRSEYTNEWTRLLSRVAVSRGRATVAGSIFRAGDYPGYRFEPKGEVIGEVWELRDPQATLALLDEYEGPEYARRIVDTDRGERAWIYTHVRELPASTRIASGDFAAP